MIKIKVVMCTNMRLGMGIFLNVDIRISTIEPYPLSSLTSKAKAPMRSASPHRCFSKVPPSLWNFLHRSENRGKGFNFDANN